MNLRTRSIVRLLTGVFLVGFALISRSGSAQDPNRIRVYPPTLRTQVGIVSHVVGDTAWIRMPSPVSAGARVEFLVGRDDRVPVAIGQVRWSAPVAPYEAYVTDIRAMRSGHTVKKEDNEGMGLSIDADGAEVQLAGGFMARTAMPPATESEAVEPVRANIRALRMLGGRTATAIADAAERALNAGSGGEDGDVDYTALRNNLRRFERLKEMPPIAERLMNRLTDIADDHGVVIAMSVAP